MYKEFVICLVVLILIFGLNYITQKNTDNTVEGMYQKLDIVRNDLIKKEPDKELSIKHAQEAYDEWENEDDIMAYYIEHDELEKVKTALTSMKSFIETEEFTQSVEAIDKCMYILEHIHEKEKFSLDNIL